MLSLRRWQLVLLLLIGSALLVKCGKKEVKEEEHEEDGGEKDEEDHFGEEGHKGEKGSHKKVNQLNPDKNCIFCEKKTFRFDQFCYLTTLKIAKIENSFVNQH